MMFRRLFAEWVILLACGVAFVLLAGRADITSRFDTAVLDRAASLARPAPSDNIVIVAFDDRSLAEIGAWPWPRERHGLLVDALNAAGAGPILFDVLFLEAASPAGDAALAEAMQRHAGTYLPHSFVQRPGTAAGLDPAMPIPPLANAARATGHVAIRPDSDGVLRRFDLVRDIDGERFEQFAVAAWDRSAPADPALRKATGAETTLPNAAIISFHPPGSYPRFSAADVLGGAVLPEFLRGKTVIVGATAQGMGDRYAVSAGDVAIMTGVETQANLLDALRQDALITEAPPFWSAGLGTAALLVQFLLFWKLSPRAGLFATLAIAALLLGVSTMLVLLMQSWAAPGAALAAVLMAYPLWSWRRLTSVSAYLEEEAIFLRPEGTHKADVEGFDQLARQVARMRRLVSHVSRSFAFLDKVIEAAPDAILVLDREGQVIMANQLAKRLFPEYSDTSPEPLADLLIASLVVYRMSDGEITLPDGRSFLVARSQFAGENGDADDDADGDTYSDEMAGGEIMVLRDVSDIREREQERREMLEFLSHDMRTPQVAIIGLSRKVAQTGSGADLGPRIRSQAERTLKLADDFVQIARLAESKPQFAETDCAALIEEAADRAYAAARAKSITIVSDIPEDGLFAEIDASLIARLLDNLLGNAIKFAPDGSPVTLGLYVRDAHWLRLSVRDEGPGLPPERLANPFARFGAHETKAGPSVGLGLTFVKRVVDVHSGEITVQSQPGAGTCFQIDVPCQRAAAD